MSLKEHLNNSQLYYSNTYNIFSRFKEKNPNMANKDLNKFSSHVYENYKHIYLGISNSGFIEETVIYENFLLSFISNDTSRILFNCSYFADKVSKPDFYLTDNHFNVIHSISNDIVGKINSITVINTCESFLNYANQNNYAKSAETNEPFLADFKNALKTSHDNGKDMKTPEGLECCFKDANNSDHKFKFAVLNKIIIITDYKKTKVIKTNTLIENIPPEWR